MPGHNRGRAAAQQRQQRLLHRAQHARRQAALALLPPRHPLLWPNKEEALQCVWVAQHTMLSAEAG